MADAKSKAALLEFLAGDMSELRPGTRMEIEARLQEIATLWATRDVANLIRDFKASGIFPGSLICCNHWSFQAFIEVYRVHDPSEVTRFLSWFAKRGWPQEEASPRSRDSGTGVVYYRLDGGRGYPIKVELNPDMEGGNCKKVKVGEKTVPVFEVQCDGDPEGEK